MNNRNAESKLDYIDNLFVKFSAQSYDDETKSHIAQYLTVLISGIFEDLIKDYIIKYIDSQTAPPEAKKYILTHIDNRAFQNPLPKKVKDFINMFSESWADSLNTNLNDRNWSALGSIVYNKNLIAHGNSSQVTLAEINRWYSDSRILIESLDTIIA